MFTFRFHSPLYLVALLTGMVFLAMLVAPISVGGATLHTRSASCAGLDFYPTDSRTEYDNTGPMRTRRNGPAAGTGVFRCDPGLPNGAVVKQVQFTAQFEGSGGESYSA